jgi:hypothetical protein
LTKTRPNFAPPPLADARRRAKYSLHFPICARPPKIFSIKEKSILLGSALNEQGGGATYSLGRLGIPPLNPPAEPSSLGQKDFLAAEFWNLALAPPVPCAGKR